MLATLEKLVGGQGARGVRSQLAEDLDWYYESVVDRLDRTPWHRGGVILGASAIAIPARVVKEEKREDERERPSKPAAEKGEDEREREREPAYRYVDPEIAALYEEPTLVTRRTVVPWAQERPQVQRAVIKGAPGGGKSFLTNTTAVDLAQEALAQLRAQRTPLSALALPVHLNLEDLAKPGLPADPAEAVLVLVRDKYKPSERLATWIHEALPTPRCWLIVDALDQVREDHRPRLRERLAAIETQRWQAHVVLTCRTANYDRGWIPWRTLSEYELAPFDPQQIRQIIDRWPWARLAQGDALRRVLDRSFSLAHACRNPLLLPLTCLAHEEQAVTEETRRVDLYAQVLRGLVRRAWGEHPLHPHDPHIDDMLGLLQHVGLWLFNLRPEVNQFTNAEVMEAIRTAADLPIPLVVRPRIAGNQEPRSILRVLIKVLALLLTRTLKSLLDRYMASLLRDELRECGILVHAGLRRGEELQFSFLHRSFLEYLAACALAVRAKLSSPAPLPLSTGSGSARGEGGWQAIAPFVDKKAWLPAWQEAIVFLAGKLPDPTLLLEMLSNPKQTRTNRQGDDYFRHRLALAALSLPEMDPALRRKYLLNLA